LLRGETLRETLARGPIPVSKAIEYSLQIALGLTAAHASRIIHRDLKPENLFVCDDGCVKILDFGLAKVIAVDDNAANAPQMSGRTDARILMGTLGYMAPEQLRGQTVDERTDIFAFGAILYEIVTGERAFQSPTPAEGIAAILNERPLLFRKRDLGIPPELERIVIRCLEKEPESRFQSSADLSHALRAVSELTTARSTLAGVASLVRRVPGIWVSVRSQWRSFWVFGQPTLTSTRHRSFPVAAQLCWPKSTTKPATRRSMMH
jgi:serine/threonine protein kinase